MKIVLTNLSNETFAASRKNLNRSAKRFGIKTIRSYDFNKDILGSRFYSENSRILSQKRGLGYWLWKPYIISEALKSVEEGDIVIYSDCGIEIIDNLQPLIELCNNREDVLLFANHNFFNGQFTKRDCFVLMDCDAENYWYSVQCDAAFMLFRKSKFSTFFVEEWLRYCTDERILTDSGNVCALPNLPGYVDHRHDQSVLSLLAEKYHINLYRKPSHSCSVVLPLKHHPKGVLVENEMALSYAKSRIRNIGPANEAVETTLSVKVQTVPSFYDRYSYDYIVSYINSNYGRLIYHHRLKNPDIFIRIQMRVMVMITKLLARYGYRLEKV